jgi:hypothetical protein
VSWELWLLVRVVGTSWQKNFNPSCDLIHRVPTPSSATIYAAAHKQGVLQVFRINPIMSQSFSIASTDYMFVQPNGFIWCRLALIALCAFLYMLLIHHASSASIGAAAACHEQGVLQVAHLIILQMRLVFLSRAADDRTSPYSSSSKSLTSALRARRGRQRRERRRLYESPPEVTWVVVLQTILEFLTMTGGFEGCIYRQCCRHLWIVASGDEFLVYIGRAHVIVIVEETASTMPAVGLDRGEDLIGCTTKSGRLLLDLATSYKLLVEAGGSSLVTAGVVKAACTVVHGRRISGGALAYTSLSGVVLTAGLPRRLTTGAIGYVKVHTMATFSSSSRMRRMIAPRARRRRRERMLLRRGIVLLSLISHLSTQGSMQILTMAIGLYDRSLFGCVGKWLGVDKRGYENDEVFSWLL